MTVAYTNATFQMWDQWRRWGVLPRRGGWMEQPLGHMLRIEAIDLVFNTISYIHGKDQPDLKKLTATQREIIRWRERRATEKSEPVR